MLGNIIGFSFAWKHENQAIRIWKKINKPEEEEEKDEKDEDEKKDAQENITAKLCQISVCVQQPTMMTTTMIITTVPNSVFIFHLYLRSCVVCVLFFTRAALELTLYEFDAYYRTKNLSPPPPQYKIVMYKHTHNHNQ